MVERPFPWTPVLILMAINISEPIAVTLLYPFAPIMVTAWVQKDEVGTFAGLLASLYNLNGMLATVFWGWFSDKFGRLRTLAILLSGSACALVMFGCSTSLGMALMARCIGGLFAGCGGVCRSIMREVVSKEQRGRAFSMFGWSWAVGMLLGPQLGGSLSQPASANTALRGTVLDTLPFLLPCASASLVCVAGLVFLPMLSSTLRKARGTPPSSSRAAPTAPSKAQDGVVAEASSDRGDGDGNGSGGGGVELRSTSSTSGSSGGGQGNGGDGASATVSNDAPDGGLPRGDGGALLVSSPPPTGGRETCLAMMRRPVLLMVYAHFTLNIQVTGLAEGFPLFALRASWRNATDIAGGDGIDGASTTLVDNGGLGLTPPDIGRALISLSLTLVISPILYPVLEKRIGHIGNLRCGLLAFSTACILMPFLRGALNMPGGGRLIWVGLVAIGVLRGFSGPMMFSAVSVLLNDLLEERIGFYNGLAMSASSLARAVGPTAIGAIYAHVTAHPGGTPLSDYHLPFFLLALLALATASLVATAIATGRGAAGSKRSRRKMWVDCRRWLHTHLRWRK